MWNQLKIQNLATPNLGLITDTICCPGMDYCALATARSIPISQKISTHFKNYNNQKEIGDLKIKVSGCINACGHHHVGNIGILGLDRKGEESYQITLGGSAKFDAYVICPASGTTIGKIAAGISDNLATRSALVALKERRKLILVPRETPVATPHLEAMAKLSTWGVVILPASPGFYKNPETIDDLIDFVVARILDQLDVEHEVGSRWTGNEVS